MKWSLREPCGCTRTCLRSLMFHHLVVSRHAYFWWTIENAFFFFLNLRIGNYQGLIRLLRTSVYFFAGEYILSSSSQNGSGSSIIEEDGPLLNEASLALDNHPLADLTDDSLGLNDTLGLEHDFTSELLGNSLLESTGVEGLLSNDTLGLPDEFNLEEALQLVGLDEAQPEVCEIPSHLLLGKATTTSAFIKDQRLLIKFVYLWVPNKSLSNIDREMLFAFISINHFLQIMLLFLWLIKIFYYLHSRKVSKNYFSFNFDDDT